MKKKIVHVVNNSSFIVGYINFMRICMNEYDHTFIFSSNNVVGTEWLEVIDKINIIRWSTVKEIAFGKEIINALLTCDQVIVSGFFGAELFCTLWPSKVLKKMHIHFWGGDFYELRDSVSIIQWRRHISWILKKRCFRKCAGAIFLIDGEYEKFNEITHIKKDKVFVAAVPRDPKSEFPFKNYRNYTQNEIVKVVVGNSATKENHHIEVLRMLERFRGEKIEIYCPLSYGNAPYREEIIKEGSKIFGEKFHAITEWMDRDDYFRFLSTCDIGIFNNDRQQAMGNITAMLFMGKKIYLRTNVSMYNNFVGRGFKIYSVAEINTCSFEQLKSFEKYEQNIQSADEWNRREKEENMEAWKRVFEA